MFKIQIKRDAKEALRKYLLHIKKYRNTILYPNNIPTII